MCTVSIDAGAALARQALVFADHLLPATSFEYLCDADVPVNLGTEQRRSLRMAAICPGSGLHSFSFQCLGEGSESLSIAVEKSVVPGDDSLAVVLRGPSRRALDGFLDAATQHVEALASHAPAPGAIIRRYLYDSGYWERLCDAPRRDPRSVFLTPAAERVAQDVVDFMTSAALRERYRVFGVPFKMNVLLQGPPGTGKTSFIESIASRLGSDVFLVQFSSKMRDGDLAVAMRKVAGYRRPIIVMEDVDVLFSGRRRDTPKSDARSAVSLSGFLNSLDGMSRPEGSVVFLTTNDAECLDEAVTRSRRIDRRLEMSYCEPGQAAAMLAAFHPDHPGIDRFVEEVSSLRFTTADLHEYLFDDDGVGVLSASHFKARARCRAAKDAGGGSSEAAAPMYS